jgi:hypothetical protein
MREFVVKRSGPLVTAVKLLIAMAISCVSPAWCQEAGTARPAESESKDSKILDKVFDYLNVANQGRVREFRPLTQKERNSMFAGSLINPVWYLKAAASAGVNQWTDTPKEWEQGASGYGKRFGDIMGQYAIRKTVMFGFESLLHEDNRYFGSGKKSFWPRAGYALSSGFLARHDNGKRYPSASLLIGFASGAYLSRFWQPPSSHSVGDAATSFGISMGWNIGLGVVKECLPDMHRPLMKGKTQKQNSP